MKRIGLVVEFKFFFGDDFTSGTEIRMKIKKEKKTKQTHSG